MPGRAMCCRQRLQCSSVTPMRWSIRIPVRWRSTSRSTPALIQYEAMLHLYVEKGVPRYNFYGISGVFDDPNDEGRGGAGIQAGL